MPIFRYSYLSGRFAPAATARLADGLRCARRQAGGVKQGGTLFHPKPTGFCPQLSRAFPARTRVHFCTHKSEPKKRQPPLGWTPALSNRTPAKAPCAATETPRFGWSLVISTVLCRTSPVGPRGERDFYNTYRRPRRAPRERPREKICRSSREYTALSCSR